MKKIIKNSLLVLAVMMMAIACRDNVRMPELQTGANARVFLYPERSFINFSDLNSASVAFDVYSANTDIDELVYQATYTDVSEGVTYPVVDAIHIPASSFVDGKATEVEISAADLATAIGLQDGVAHFEGGDF